MAAGGNSFIRRKGHRSGEMGQGCCMWAQVLQDQGGRCGQRGDADPWWVYSYFTSWEWSKGETLLGLASRPHHGGKSSSRPPHPRCQAAGWARRRDSGAVAVTAPLGNIWLQAPESTGKR